MNKNHVTQRDMRATLRLNKRNFGVFEISNHIFLLSFFQIKGASRFIVIAIPLVHGRLDRNEELSRRVFFFSNKQRRGTRTWRITLYVEEIRTCVCVLLEPYKLATSRALIAA